MSVEIKGFKELEENLELLREQLEALDGESRVSLSELFPDDFMATYSDFESIEEFIDESPWEIETNEDFKRISEDKFDEYIDEHTGFSNWDAMLSAAAREWVSRQLASSF
jgi:hypothetical protein